MFFLLLLLFFLLCSVRPGGNSTQEMLVLQTVVSFHRHLRMSPVVQLRHESMVLCVCGLES